MVFGKNPSGSQPKNAAPTGGGRNNSSSNRVPGGGLKPRGKEGSSRSLIKRDLKGNIWFIGAVVGALLVSLGMFFITNQLNSTSTYYVLNQNVPAGTQITPAMLQEVVVTSGGQPRNALTIGDVNAEPAITKFSLNAGDIVTISNTGPLTDLNADIPANFVVASFTAPAERSVAGQLERGNYIDIIAVNSGVSTYVLRHVLILDAAAGAASAGNTQEQAPADSGGSGGIGGIGGTTPSADTTAGGVPTLYTVALSPDDAAVLALVQELNLLVVLSPAAYEDSPVFSENIQKQLDDLFNGTYEAGDSGVGTDPTFGSGVVDENVVTNPNSQESDGTELTETPVPSEPSEELVDPNQEG